MNINKIIIYSSARTSWGWTDALVVAGQVGAFGVAGAATVAVPVIAPVAFGAAAIAGAVWRGAVENAADYLRALGRLNSRSNNREQEDDQNQDEQ